MTRTKLDERIENAMNAFFEAETDTSRFEMTYKGHDAAIAADELAFTEKAGKWTGVAREVLLFGPGTFFLFYTTLMGVYFYPTSGLTFQGTFMILASAFFTYAGSGSLNRTKNLAVPTVVITAAAAVAFVSSLFPTKEQSDVYFWYSLYLFPNVLIAAKLVQLWLSGKK